MMSNYTEALYRDTGATLDDLREAVTTLEETERIARRVLGGAHPLAAEIEDDLQDARDALELRSKLDLDTAGEVSTPRKGPHAP